MGGTQHPVSTRRGRPHRAALLAVLAGTLLLTVGPGAASACSGVDLDFDEALRRSDGAVFGGLVTRSRTEDTFWLTITLRVDHVVRGSASSRVERIQSGHVCDGIHEGEYGYVVRDVVNPERGTSEPHDLFFHVSRREAAAVLGSAGLPATDAEAHTVDREPDVGATPWLAMWLLATLGLTLALVESGSLRRRRDRR